MNAKILLVIIAVNLVYSLIGGAIMMALESSNEESTTNDITSVITTFLSDHSTCLTSSELEAFLTQVKSAYDSGVFTTNQTSTATQWDYGNSIFFVITASTTIGYGNQTPSTRGGKAFIVVYAIFGIPLTGLMIIGIAEKLKKFYNYLNDKKLPCLVEHPKTESVIKYSLLHLLALTVLVLIPSAIFYAIEDWTYGDAIYYSIITFTTVGFGDFVVGTNTDGGRRIVYKLLVLVWIVVGLAWIGSMISEFTDKYKTFVEKQEKKNKVEENENDKESEKSIEKKAIKDGEEYSESKKKSNV